MLKILKKEHEVKSILQKLDLQKDKLAEVSIRAIAQKFTAVENHPCTAPGTFAYHEGVKSLRDQFVDGVNWEKLTEKNIEFIYNRNKNIKIIYQNVDFACVDDYDPQPLSRHGGTAKQSIFKSNQLELFPEIKIDKLTPSINVFVLCVSEHQGIVNAELSRPREISSKGIMSKFSDRIYILQDYDFENDPYSRNNDMDEYDDEIEISVKN